MVVTRDYGETANEKANELLFHLGLATVSIVVLVAVAIGWREALVVAVVIPTTILLTLFASHIMGYTLNRVSLFALIFSIGILVDDAIVVIENIARHWAFADGRSRRQAAIDAVAEVGNPTIVATLTVVKMPRSADTKLRAARAVGVRRLEYPTINSTTHEAASHRTSVMLRWTSGKAAPVRRIDGSASGAFMKSGPGRASGLFFVDRRGIERFFADDFPIRSVFFVRPVETTDVAVVAGGAGLLDANQ